MKKSSVPRGEKGFCSWPPTWLLWRHVQTSNCTAHTISKAFLFRKTTRRSLMTATYSVTLTAWGSAGLWFLMWFFRVNNLKCFISGRGVAKHHEIYFSFLLRPPVSRRSSSVSNKKGTKSARFEDHAMHCKQLQRRLLCGAQQEAGTCYFGYERTIGWDSEEP